LSRPFRLLPFVALLSALAAASRAPAAEPDAVTTRVTSVTSTGYRVLVSVAEPRIVTGEAFGERLSEISLPGAASRLPAGYPQIPSVSLLLRVPPDVRARAIAVAVDPPRDLGALRPVPFPGLLSATELWSGRGMNAVALMAALEAPPYREGSGAPQPLLARAAPSAAGGERLLEILLDAVQWDPRSGRLSYVDRIEVEVSWDRAVSPFPGGGPDMALDAVGPRYAAPAARASRAASAYTGPLRVTPDRPWVRLGVIRPGLYALSPSDLAQAGVSTAAIDPASFRLFRAAPGDLPESVSVDLAPDSLRECAIAVTGEGDGLFDPGDRIYFYATGCTGFGYDLVRDGGVNHQETERSDEEALWLTWGGGSFPTPPRRMGTREAAPVDPGADLTVLPHRVHYEENRIRDFPLVRAGLRWDRWFWFQIFQGSRIAFPVALPGALPGAQASLALRMWGKGVSVGGTVADHYVNLYWDRILIASGSWNFSDPRDFTASGFTVHANDTLEVEVPRVADPSDPRRFDQSYLAWFEVTYPRRLAAINDTLAFAADSSGVVHYAIAGVSDTTAAWLLDRTDPESPVRLVDGVFSAPPGPYTLRVQDSLASGSPHRYFLASTARAPRPATVARYAPATTVHTTTDLLDPLNGADYVIVAPEALLAPAESLATYRSARLSGFPSPRVAVATTERIAAQLGGGSLTAVSIRNFLAYAFLHWTGPPPLYVCLLGDASYDPKNYLGFGAPDLLPAYSRYWDGTTPDGIVQYISDDFYGFLGGPGDDVLDLAIGRLPAKNPAEGMTLVRGKLQAYEGATEFDPWRARALLCADDSWKRDARDVLGNLHVIEMERKDHRHLPYPIERSKVYLNDYAFSDTTHASKPAAREDFIAKINQGNWLVDYIGHGSDVVIADEQVFRDANVGRLTNAARPSLFGFFSCTVGRFDSPSLEGLGELLLKTPTGGAAASMAATEIVFPIESTQLNDNVVDQLFPIAPRVDSTATVGLAWARAKNQNRNSIARKYVLLGDPGLSLPIPRGRGVWEKTPLDSVLRGDLVVLQGHALNPDSTADTLSTGTVYLQIQGKPIQRVQYGLNTLNTIVPTTYEVPGAVLYRGDAALDRGRFTARFVVPLDPRIAGGAGQLRALLSAAGGRGVGLAVDSLRIGQGIGSRTDLTPPTITLRYAAGADSSVQPGDRLTIVLQDSSGIDLMRLDNAHTIFVILDDRGTPTELTPAFAYDPGSFTSGSVPFVVPQLAEGLHTLEVHASDVFGNIAIRSFVLDVHAPAHPGDPVQLTQVFNYPNPFEGPTYIHARLNQGARLRVQILTVSGRRIRELSSDARAGENYVPWDGKDSEGENVAIGVYLIRVTAESSGGRRASVVARALRTK